MAITPGIAKVRDLLLNAGLVDEYQMRAALGRLEQWGGRLPKVLADMGMLTEETSAQVLAGALRMPMQGLGTVVRDGAALSRLDMHFCEEHAVFPISLNTRTHTLTLAMADPTELDVVDLVAARVNARVSVVVATESQILAAIGRHYRGEEPAMTQRRVSREVSVEPMGLELDDSAPAPMPTRSGGLSPAMKATPSANTLLDEMMGEGDKERGYTQEELARIGNLRLTHERTSLMLRALQELLREKGFLA